MLHGTDLISVEMEKHSLKAPTEVYELEPAAVLNVPLEESPTADWGSPGGLMYSGLPCISTFPPCLIQETSQKIGTN